MTQTGPPRVKNFIEPNPIQNMLRIYEMTDPETEQCLFQTLESLICHRQATNNFAKSRAK